MNSWGAEIRRREAAVRREEREEKKRQRELERRRKEQAKLSALDQARLEVESYENELEVLLSVHRDQSEPVDWRAFASALPRHLPLKLARHELAAQLEAATSPLLQENERSALEEARMRDEQEHQTSIADHARESAESDAIHELARRVLRGESRAYTEAVARFSALGEMANLGSSIHLTVHNAQFVKCDLNVNGREIVPPNTKSLSAAGKVVVKAMPKAQFHELYQDYVCSCVLRVARELFALLPIELVLITATVDGIDMQTGHPAKLPVLSLAAPRSVIETLRFGKLDPSDSLVNFQHRGEVMASRKSGAFVPIGPLSPSDITGIPTKRMDLRPLTARVEQFRAELTGMLRKSRDNEEGCPTE